MKYYKHFIFSITYCTLWSQVPISHQILDQLTFDLNVEDNPKKMPHTDYNKAYGPGSTGTNSPPCPSKVSKELKENRKEEKCPGGETLPHKRTGGEEEGEVFLPSTHHLRTLSLDVPPPLVLTKAIHVPDKVLMGPGPSNCDERVLQAQALPTLGHLHPEFTHIMDEIKAGVQYIFQTNNAMSLALSCTGHGAMEAVMVNMLEHGTRILIADNGIWGQRSAIMARRHGGDVRTVTAPPGSSFTLSQIEAAIKEHKPKILFVTHGESSTGVKQNLEGIGPLCHSHNCLFAVDAVASLGGVPVLTDQLEIDVIYTGSQKVLGVPPGLSLISFSPRAVSWFQARTTPPISFYLDLGWLSEYWACYPGKPRVYHHTAPVNAMYGLREGLAIIAEEGLENSWLRHRISADRLHEGLTALNLEMFVTDPESRLPTVNTVKVPEGLDWKAVVDYCMKNHQVEIAGGLGPTVGKVWRIGVMGNNANIRTVNKVLDALEDALNHVNG